MKKESNSNQRIPPFEALNQTIVHVVTIKWSRDKINPPIKYFKLVSVHFHLPSCGYLDSSALLTQDMQLFREILLLLYQFVIIVLSLVFYGVFLCIWGITYPLYWIARLIQSIWKTHPKETKSVVVSGAGSGMGQMICVQYAKQVDSYSCT